MAVAQFFDFGTFVVMVRQHGAGAEANPLVASILDDFGIPGAALAKAALVLLVASVALLLARRPDRHRDRISALLIFVAIGAGVVGGWTNALTIRPW